MKLKALGAAVLILSMIASASSAVAGLNQARVRRHGIPGAPTVPGHPPVPQRPTVPFPGFPDDPEFPTDPSVPPPGTPNPKGGPEVPFPLNITLPFPWGNIEGLWKVVSDGIEIVFSFTVQVDTNGHQYLRVVQINPSTGVIVGEGVGIGVENDKLVRAAMTAKTSKINYMLFIGSYKNTNAYVVGGQATKAVTVVTIRPFSALMGDEDVQVIVTKVSNSPLAVDDSVRWTF